MKRLAKLVSIASPALGHRLVTLPDALPGAISTLLRIKNGFFAFESALLVRASVFEGAPLSSEAWNAQDGWKHAFKEKPSSWCFAENIFGEQFCIDAEGVTTFDPETSEIARIAGSLEEWANLILSDFDYRTGYPLAKEWQARHGALKPGTRLLPKRPFVLGGDFDISNLRVVDETHGMRLRAEIANQVHDLADGEQVTLPSNYDGGE